MPLTENETKIIEFLREAKPFERIEISKDSSGIPDYYIIKREQKLFLKENEKTIRKAIQR